MMKVLLVGPRGFCAGVNMAIDSLEKALELFGTPLYVFHEIVHNRHVVERFSRRGVVFVDLRDRDGITQVVVHEAVTQERISRPPPVSNNSSFEVVLHTVLAAL